jgi:hypothetical protein
MSAGGFEDAKYGQDSGTNVWPCRAQPETKGLTLGGTANAYPAAAVTAGLPTIKLRKSKREFGLAIRTVTVELTEDGSDSTAEYASGTLHVVPVFVKATWDGYTRGQTGTYLGIACRFAGKSAGI